MHVVATTTADVVDEVAAALRADAVFVDPNAERALSPSEADELRSAIVEAGTPLFIAVIPQSALTATSGDPGLLTEQIAEATGLDGTYAVLVGDSFRAGSTELPAGRAGQLATTAFQAHRDEGPAAVLLDFVDRIGGETSSPASNGSSSNGSQAGGSQTGSTSESDDSDGIGVGTVLLVGGAAGVGVWAWRRGRRRKAELAERARADQADRQMMQAELSVLADDVLRLENDVLLHPDARDDYDVGVESVQGRERSTRAGGRTTRSHPGPARRR